MKLSVKEKRQPEITKYIPLLLCALFLLLFMGTQAEAAAKKGLVRENGAWYFYQGGKPVKNRWKTIAAENGSSRYYFGADGKAVCGTAKNARLKKIGKYTYAFDKKGRMVTGVRLIKGKLYYFAANGRYSKARSLKLRSKAKYLKNAEPLVSLLKSYGCVLRKTEFFEKGCLGTSQDGLYTFHHFQIQVLKHDTGEVVIMELLPLN